MKTHFHALLLLLLGLCATTLAQSQAMPACAVSPPVWLSLDLLLTGPSNYAF
jgi:hypothetical protein